MLRRRIWSPATSDPSTISRELVRNTGARGYRFKQAHEKASQRREEASNKPRKMTPDLVELIEEKLTQEQWSPDQISGRLAKDGVAFISHERIYQHVWKDKKDGGTLYLRIPAIAPTCSDASRPPVPNDRDQHGVGCKGAVRGSADVVVRDRRPVRGHCRPSAIEAVLQDRMDRAVGARADLDGAATGSFEARMAIGLGEPQDADAGAETLLGVRPLPQDDLEAPRRLARSRRPAA